MAGDDEALGPWERDDFASTAREGIGVGADQGIPTDIRFRRNVAKLLRRRAAEDKNNSDPKALAVFLFRADPELNSEIKPTRIPMLDNGLERLCGRLWLMGGGPSCGWFIENPHDDDDRLFRFVTDDLSLAETPAIIYDPRPTFPEARFFSKGLSCPDDYYLISVLDESIDFEKVAVVVDAVYKRQLVTPAAQNRETKLWEDEKKWWPKRGAEGMVQAALMAGLTGAFLTCNVRQEQPMPAGRLDLEIEQSDALERWRITRIAVLELKILRAFGETGTIYTDAETDEWVKSGVEQVGSYQIEKGFRWAALLCFDMRKKATGEACFSKVKEMAGRLKVHLQCWHLFASTKEYQQHLVGA